MRFLQPVQAVLFEGSSSSAHAIQEWVATGTYRRPAVQTRDIVELIIDIDEDRIRATAGQWIVRDAAGRIRVATSVSIDYLWPVCRQGIG